MRSLEPKSTHFSLDFFQNMTNYVFQTDQHTDLICYFLSSNEDSKGDDDIYIKKTKEIRISKLREEYQAFQKMNLRSN